MFGRTRTLSGGVRRVVMDQLFCTADTLKLDFRPIYYNVPEVTLKAPRGSIPISIMSRRRDNRYKYVYEELILKPNKNLKKIIFLLPC